MIRQYWRYRYYRPISSLRSTQMTMLVKVVIGEFADDVMVMRKWRRPMFVCFDIEHMRATWWNGVKSYLETNICSRLLYMDDLSSAPFCRNWRPICRGQSRGTAAFRRRNHCVGRFISSQPLRDYRRRIPLLLRRRICLNRELSAMTRVSLHGIHLAML